MESIFLNDWADKGIERLKSDFEITDDELEGVEILLASYTYECYSGDAFVLFRKDGKYFEVNGGHCSCYGLEDQWEPEEASLDELYHRTTKGTLGNYENNEFANELKAILFKLKEGE